MTFLAPAFLIVGLASAAALVVLHLITRDRPPRAPMPTARFVPGRSERAISRAMRPADPLLLLLRASILVLAAAAFARPVIEPERRLTARIVLLDVSRAMGDFAAARDSALDLLADGDALVLFDSTARVVEGAARDSLALLASDTFERTRARGVLSAALIAAQRAAVPLRDRADSIEMVIVSPLVREELDAATQGVRALWPGRLRVVRVPAATHEYASRRPELRADPDDPLVASVALLAPSAAVRARIVRGIADSADSAHARNGGVLVKWPRDAGADGWSTRAAPDTVGAVVAGRVVLIAPFERRYAPPAPEAAPFRVAARWVDGEPAALERSLGEGCVREVAIPVDVVGDLALRAGMLDLVDALSEPCGGAPDLESIDDSTLAALSGAGPLAAAARVVADRSAVTPLVPWLLGAALLLALLEPLARRIGSRA